MKLYQIKNSLARLVICLVLAVSIVAGFPGNAHAATKYNVDIQLNQETRTFLKDNGYSLYAFKGINAGKGAESTVWLKLTGDKELYNQPVININWEEDYYIGETTTSFQSGATVVGTSPFVEPDKIKSISVGKAYTYEGTTGWDQNPGTSLNPQSFEILNTPQSVNNFYVSQKNSIGSTAANDYIVVKPVVGNGGLADFEPIQTVSFILATTPLTEGTIIFTAFSPGIVGTVPNDGTPLQLTYDINKGWSGPSGSTEDLKFGSDIYEAMLSAAN